MTVVAEQQFFSEDEAEQILQRAAKQDRGVIDEVRLFQMADELGISREAVLESAQQVRAENLEREDRKQFDIYQRRSFLSHLATYVGTCAFFLVINYLTEDHSISWAWWFVGIWGIGLVNQLWSTFAKHSADYEKEFRQWRIKRDSGQPMGYLRPRLGVHFHSSRRGSDMADEIRERLFR